ncbi:MAG: sporulation protein YtfJ [Clostridia bacterium]|nr:sporulation protein YtfJ [Clostridia bacterium]
MEENKVSDLFSKTLESAKGVVDSNTVMGTPITTPQGTTIIPVSKVSVGFAGGGTDFASRKDAEGKKNFGGGGGTGVTAKPVGFLVIDAEGGVKFISVDEPANNEMTVSELAAKLPAIFAKIKEFFEKKKAEKEEVQEAEEDKKSAEGKITE